MRSFQSQVLERQADMRQVQGKGENAQNNATPAQTTTPPLSTSPCSPGEVEATAGVPFLDSPFTTFDTSLDDFIASLPTPPCISVSATPNQNNPSQPNISPEYTHGSCAASSFPLNQADIPLPSYEDSLYTSNETGLDPLEYGLDALACTVQTTQLSQLGATPNLNGGSEQPDCLKTALRLMGQLSCRGSPLSASPTPTGYEHQATLLQTIIEKNREAIDTISAMLQFTCSQDGYFLVVVSLVISKVLSGYAAAARVPSAVENDAQSLNTPVSASSSRWPTITAERIPTPPLKTEEIDPMTAQRVLNELYRVQGLIDQLASKVQLCARRNNSFSSEDSLLDDDTLPTTFPFSATVLSLLTSELRKRLSTLSLELIDGLKQYWR
ncbi:hypothetical protein DL764_002907 [Monosporascus ibericus]|uniref:Aflatoxin regulatory protein domain-containing protein n=1 Tax=Monosporascus ibericus TaxID=155417 RepID=A0A4V1XBN4_9PEZI|nr:hypothetical protein DL764_002907 [Monosporascus ibericus]